MMRVAGLLFWKKLNGTSLRMWAWTCVLAVLLTAMPLRAGEPASPAVIELFTSQGCSSCPPADELLAKLAKRKDVIAISLHVDYWDYLGWKDTLASAANTARQKSYAHKHGDNRIYTPEAVINGLIGVVGSDAAAIDRALQKTQRELEHVRVAVAIAEDRDEIRLEVGPAPPGSRFRSGTVWIVPITSEERVAIERGENRGRTMTYHNIARRLVRVGQWHGDAVQFTLAREDVMVQGADACAVLLQGEDSGAILGAAKLGGS